MIIDMIATHPRRPLSEVEWEDLLLRLEIMPKALNVALEEVDRQDPEILSLLSDMVVSESLAGEFIEQAAGIPNSAVEMVQLPSSLEDALDRFVRLRARNFAMVQRRGIEVWEWEAKLPSTGPATVHQMLMGLAMQDVEALAVIRRSSRTDQAVC